MNDETDVRDLSRVYWTLRQFADDVGVKLGTVRRWSHRYAKKFPKPVYLFSGETMAHHYRAEELLEFYRWHKETKRKWGKIDPHRSAPKIRQEA